MRDSDEAELLINGGRKAINSNDVDALRSIVQQLLALLPPAQQDAMRKGFDSTVI